MDIGETPSNFRELMGFDARNEVIYEDDAGDNSIPDIQKITKRNNVLPTWGNPTTMNMNTLLLENIVQSTYYKNYLVEVISFQQACEQILHSVKHLEPWERGTRKTYGMTGMCGGVRGVGAGGVISTAFCVLYKLFALKLTRKQLVGMINSTQSVFMRGMGFLYIRYTQPPGDLWACRLHPQRYLNDYEDRGNQRDVRDYERREDKPAAIKRKTRCSHHLRHHHCRKHRSRCPRKAKKTEKVEVEMKEGSSSTLQ